MDNYVDVIRDSEGVTRIFFDPRRDGDARDAKRRIEQVIRKNPPREDA